MLLFGIFLAVIGIVLTRKTEIVTHDPSEGLPGAGNPFSGVVDGVKSFAQQLEQEARREQERARNARPASGQLGRPQQPSGDPGIVILERIKDLAQRGQLVEAIRLYRQNFRVDMKAAREAVIKLAEGG